jgi:hypothetical protein
MQLIPNDIVLRPRFQLDLNGEKNALLEAFEKGQKNPITVKRLDDHLFIKFEKKETNFWTPQLHLEINEIDTHNSKLYGLFGPNPTLWTFFMFLHFGVATLFIILGIWAYVSATLGKAYVLQVVLMVLLALVWIALYVFGRLGKRKGRPQMEILHRFMMQILVDQ